MVEYLPTMQIVPGSVLSTTNSKRKSSIGYGIPVIPAYMEAGSLGLQGQPLIHKKFKAWTMCGPAWGGPKIN